MTENYVIHYKLVRQRVKRGKLLESVTLETSFDKKAMLKHAEQERCVELDPNIFYAVVAERINMPQ